MWFNQIVIHPKDAEGMVPDQTMLTASTRFAQTSPSEHFGLFIYVHYDVFCFTVKTMSFSVII